MEEIRERVAKLRQRGIAEYLLEQLIHPDNHQLHTVSEYCGYHLANHHHALADAEACAWIAREIL